MLIRLRGRLPQRCEGERKEGSYISTCILYSSCTAVLDTLEFLIYRAGLRKGSLNEGRRRDESLSLLFLLLSSAFASLLFDRLLREAGRL